MNDKEINIIIKLILQAETPLQIQNAVMVSNDLINSSGLPKRKTNNNNPIYFIRKALGLTQREFGELVHTSHILISNYERGFSRPAERTLNRINNYIRTFSDNELKSLGLRELTASDFITDYSN